MFLKKAGSSFFSTEQIEKIPAFYRKGYLMKKVVFISIDKPERWSEWHSGDTDTVYYSRFFDTENEVNEFKTKVKKDYPDSNLIDGKCSHEYFIKYVVLDFEENDAEGFKTLLSMMRAYKSYEK